MTQEHIRDFQKGSQKVFKEIFRNLYPRMCSFANKFLRCDEDAEDIVQEVFIELWRKREKISNEDQIKAFLYLSIKNRCLNFIKHLKVKQKYSQLILQDEESFFQDHLLEAEFISHVEKSINLLSKQRMEIILLGMKGLKNKEIAEDLNISVNTVKMQKKIAYKQLREHLNKSLSLILYILTSNYS